MSVNGGRSQIEVVVGAQKSWIGEEGTSKVDWRSLFSAASDQTLQFYSPLKSNGKLMVAPPLKVFEEGNKSGVMP